MYNDHTNGQQDREPAREPLCQEPETEVIGEDSEFDTRPAAAAFTHTNQPPLRTAGSPPPQWQPVYDYDEPKPKKERSRTRVLVLIIFALVLITSAALIFMGDGVPILPESGYVQEDLPTLEEYYADASTAEISIPSAKTGTGVTVKLTAQPRGEELSLQEIYKKCAPSVVAITAKADGQSGYSWGTGIILTEDGYIITNTHVLEGSASVTVTLADDREFEGRLVGFDSASDIAVLKIDAEALQAAEFGDASQLEVGDGVVAIGNPLGEQLRGTMTDGIVSAINRDIPYKGHSMTLLQTNAAINEGNSGGPLINMYGQVVGVTNMKMSSYYSSIEGIGFAIPTGTMKAVVDELIELGFIAGQPMIGFTIGPIPEELGLFHSLPAGLYVTEVQQKSDAWKKGIRKGDIVTAVNDTPVTTTAEVTAIKDSLEVGDSMILTIWRDGELFDVDVVLMDASQLD